VPRTALALLAIWTCASASGREQDPGAQGGVLRDPRPELELSDWSILGPFDNPAGAAVDVDLGPDRLVKRMRAGEPWTAMDEGFLTRGRKKVSWRRFKLPAAPNATPFDSGPIDLARQLDLPPAEAERSAAYLYREIRSADERDVSIACGSDDGLRLWLNGELLVDRAEPRALNPYDERVTLHLRSGRNHLLAKVTNLGGAWSFAMLAPQPATQDEIDEAIRRGVAWLLDRQLYDGSWAGEQDAYRSGMTALVANTLLHCGVSPRRQAVLQAFENLSALPAERTYSVACQVLALTALGDPARRAELEGLVEKLLGWQESSGGWSYPGLHADLSNTQFAAVALRAAAEAGVAIQPKVWSETIDFVFRHQEGRHRSQSPGFSYLPGDTATGSMTCGGIVVLAVCREQLGARLAGKSLNEVEDAIDEGLVWLDRNWSVARNPRKGDHHLYYLYALERLGALLARDKVGDHDWYAEGAQWLVRSQGPAGDWSGTEADTCFALLFLRRATHASRSGARGLEATAVVSTPEGGPLRLHVLPTTPARFWIDPPALAAGAQHAGLEFEVRGPAGEWTSIRSDPGQPDAASFAFPGPGAWNVRARLTLADGSWLESGVLRVTYDEGLAPAAAERARSALANRLLQVFPAVTSSSARDGAPPASAADGRSWTRWLCKAEDAMPWIDVEIVRPTPVARLTFFHARTTGAENAALNPRATRVRLWIDRESTPRTVELDPDPRAQSIVTFSPPLTLTRFRVEIETIVDGTLGAAELGFSEIGLERAQADAGAGGR
jgi:hypothetical protein